MTWLVQHIQERIMDTPGGWIVIAVVFLVVAINVIDMGRKRNDYR